MAKKKKKSSSSPKKAARNPLYGAQQTFLNSLSERERNELFHPEIDPDRRAQLWMDQADLGEALVNQYAWATPSPHALKILKEFSPIVEVGCGANAYWASCMKGEGIDVIAYDMQIDTGGKIKSKNGKGKDKTHASESLVQHGGPESLEKHKDRALFLCYPDEDGEGMGEECLKHYAGKYVIHVGETILDSNLSMDQAPWGRSSSSEFQTRLAAEYHCILKIEIPSWLHVRDSVSIWKRSETSTIVFAADSEEEDEEDEEIEYRHIPCSERLPINVAAPCCAHLLPPTATTTAVPAPPKDEPAETKQRARSNSAEGTKKKKSEEHKMKTTPTETKEPKSPPRSRSRSESHDSSSSKKDKKRSRSDSTDSKRSRSDSVDSQKKRKRSDSVGSTEKKRKRSNSTDSASKRGGRERSDSTDSAKKRRKLEKEHQKSIDSLFAGGYEVEATPPRKRSKGNHTSPW
eukprot:CAMPEP_0113639930 /NCGR_PEP_ID=MMETSP0017_2-20120614/20955_1 /TAXON_ID=2856 /ORGANISM="Cylindrotheca closterium" /LENGTH=460 /DNA_ID=CAMNT_0000551183 /DNA_START=20 /DNA_END=1402 /DNA_ORIENTATION=- /assembly_acc=CAM_ASM_000147